jgi:hypothetical protein
MNRARHSTEAVVRTADAITPAGGGMATADAIPSAEAA